MKTTLVTLVGLMLVALAFTGCLEDKVLEIVLTGETSAVIHENETGLDEADEVVVDMATEIQNILDDNDYSVSDIDSAFVTSVHYGVNSPYTQHDWTLTGTISVSRDFGPFEVIVNYQTEQTLPLVGQKKAATLEQDGVDVVNQALYDFIANGDSPVLTFRIVSGTITPPPSGADPMIFDWTAWLAIQLITEQTVEVPDPF
jgi:hypothetical protein